MECAIIVNDFPDRHSSSSSYQRLVVSHRGTAGHPELHRQLLLPLQTPYPPVETAERSAAESASGGADSLPRAPHANASILSVLYCVTPGEPQPTV